MCLCGTNISTCRLTSLPVGQRILMEQEGGGGDWGEVRLGACAITHNAAACQFNYLIAISGTRTQV